MAERSRGDRLAETPQFLPVAVLGSTAANHSQAVSATIVVVLPGGSRIVVTPGFDAETLRRVVAVLEDRPC